MLLTVLLGPPLTGYDVIVTGRPCPKYSLPFAVITPDEGVYEDVITVECQYGYQFPDTSKVKYLECRANGQWSQTLASCERE